MMNEGFLGSHTISGERAATGDHPVVVHYLPLDASVTSALPIGTVMKRVLLTETTGEGDDAVTTVTGTAWAPLAVDDDVDVLPVAVVDYPCKAADTTALCVVHGGVKARLLVLADGETAPNDVQLAQLAERGVWAM